MLTFIHQICQVIVNSLKNIIEMTSRLNPSIFPIVNIVSISLSLSLARARGPATIMSRENKQIRTITVYMKYVKMS